MYLVILTLNEDLRVKFYTDDTSFIHIGYINLVFTSLKRYIIIYGVRAEDGHGNGDGDESDHTFGDDACMTWRSRALTSC